MFLHRQLITHRCTLQAMRNIKCYFKFRMLSKTISNLKNEYVTIFQKTRIHECCIRTFKNHFKVLLGSTIFGIILVSLFSSLKKKYYKEGQFGLFLILTEKYWLKKLVSLWEDYLIIWNKCHMFCKWTSAMPPNYLHRGPLSQVKINVRGGNWTPNSKLFAKHFYN